MVEKYEEMKTNFEMQVIPTLEDFKELFSYESPRVTEVETFAHFTTNMVCFYYRS